MNKWLNTAISRREFRFALTILFFIALLTLGWMSLNIIGTFPVFASTDIWEAINEIQKDLGDLEKRLIVIEEAIVQNPEKVLNVTLLDERMDGLEKTIDTELTSLKEDVKQLVELRLWFFGQVVVMILGFAGMIYTIRPRKSESQKETDKESKLEKEKA
jgi:hypothetical protein